MFVCLCVCLFCNMYQTRTKADADDFLPDVYVEWLVFPICDICGSNITEMFHGFTQFFTQSFPVDLKYHGIVLNSTVQIVV